MKTKKQSTKLTIVVFCLSLFSLIFNSTSKAQSNLCSAYPNWLANTTYNANDKVVYNGNIYTAKWWVQNTAPDKPGATVWKDNGACVLVNQDPSVSINSPANNDNFASASTIAITVSAADVDGNIDSVFFYIDNNLVGIDIYEPFTFNWVGAADGTYQITAKAKDNNGAVSTSAPVTISVSGTTSIYANEVKSIAVYPNPSNGLFQFSSENLVFQHLVVSNLLGEIVLEGNVKSGNNIINLSNFSNGTYYLTLTGNNSSIKQKLMLNK